MAKITANHDPDLLTRVVLVSLCLLWIVLFISWWQRPLQRDDLTSQRLGYQLPINAASADELRALHGIGPALAERIVQHREDHGPYTGPPSLEAVSGIGPRTRARIEPWLRFD